MVKKAIKKEAAKPVSKKITPELICEVIEGKWGDEKERSAKLKAAGYAPSVVTKKINALTMVAIDYRPLFVELGEYLPCVMKLIEK